MKRWRTTTFMIFAFVVGFTFTYACGGGSSSNAADYAPLVHTHDASDITGYIDADAVGGFDASVIASLIEAVCMLSFTTSFDVPSGIDCASYQKTVFVTSGSYDGNLGGLAGGDAICQAAADSAALAGTYYAWLSSSTQSPSTTFTQSGVPYVLVDGTVVANNWSDLTDNSLDNPINLDANSSIGSGYVWSGTYSDGTASSLTCGDWNSTSSGGGLGDTSAINNMWTSGRATENCLTNYRLYCFQQ